MKPKLCLELFTLTAPSPYTTSPFKYVYLNHTLTTVWLLRIGWEERVLPQQSVLFQRQKDIFQNANHTHTQVHNQIFTEMSIRHVTMPILT